MKNYRHIIVRLFQEGKHVSEISQPLNLVKSTVSRTIKRFQETCSNNDIQGKCRPRTSNTNANRKKIKLQIQKNPRLSSRKIAKFNKIPRTSVQRIIKNDLKLKSYKLQKAQLLTDSMKNLRLKRCQALRKRFSNNRHRSIVFSDEKLFTIEQSHNRQNDRIWSKEAPSPQDRIVSRSHKPKSLMIWAGITYNGKTPLVFIDQGVKINQEFYKDEILQKFTALGTKPFW